MAVSSERSPFFETDDSREMFSIDDSYFWFFHCLIEYKNKVVTVGIDTKIKIIAESHGDCFTFAVTKGDTFICLYIVSNNTIHAWYLILHAGLATYVMTGYVQEAILLW